MANKNLFLKPGTLLETIEATAHRAKQSGVLHSIPTQRFYLSDQGIDFLVRKVENLAEKDRETRRARGIAGGKSKNIQNPFLPYDENMYVAHITENHVCLLNKFNVVENHILLVTTQFEHQESLLTSADFEALTQCLLEFNSLGFYNGGQISGASQPHKHLQVVPLPLSPEGPSLPVEPAISAAKWNGDLGQSDKIPFAHFLARLPQPNTSPNPRLMAKILHGLYRTLLEESPVTVSSSAQGERASPYNLLATRNWMMLVPRTREFFGTISFNSLAFAGALLVRTKNQQQELEKSGCGTALKFVTT